MSVIKVIVGSTRPNRFGIQPANWLIELGKQIPNATFELVDLVEVDLPFLNEAGPALTTPYMLDHTKAWAKVIGEADGFVFVTPEYNHSYPAALKNAIDYLAAEWRYKPAVFMSYGADAGGMRAVEHLRNVVTNLGMFDLREQVAIINYWNNLDEQGQFTAFEALESDGKKMLERVAFWADRLKPIREELGKAKS